MFCRKCGAPNRDDAQFCEKCGEEIVFCAKEAPKTTVKKKMTSKRFFLLTIPIFLIICIYIAGYIALPLITGEKANKEEIPLTTNEKNNTENFPIAYSKDGAVIIRSADGKDIIKVNSNIFAISENGEYISYREDDGDYITKLKDSDKKFKFDLDYFTYDMSPDYKHAMLVKWNDNRSEMGIYITDFEDTWEIAKCSEYPSPRFSADGKYIFFRSDGVTYIRETKENGDIIKVDSDIYILNFSQGGDLILDSYVYTGELYYLKNETLYYKKNDKESVKVLSGVLSTENCGYVGDAFYVKGEDGVYYIDGDKAEKLSTDAIGPNYMYTMNIPTLFTLYANASEDVSSSSNRFLTTDGRLLELPEEYRIILVSRDGKYAYCITESDDLCRYKIKSGGVGEKEEIATNVYYREITKDHDVFIITEKDDKFTFSIYDGKLTDIAEMQDISSPRIMYAEDGTAYFAYDKNDKTVLMRYTIGDDELEEIDSGITDLDIRSKDLYYYIKDNNLYLKKGNKKPKLIDEDVNEFEWGWNGARWTNLH